MSRYYLNSNFPTPLLASRCRATQQAWPWCLRSNKADTLHCCIRPCASVSLCIMQSISYSLSQKDILPLANNTVVICGCYCSDRPWNTRSAPTNALVVNVQTFIFILITAREGSRKNKTKQENRKKIEHNISTGRYHLSFSITASQRLLFSLSSL